MTEKDLVHLRGNWILSSGRWVFYSMSKGYLSLQGTGKIKDNQINNVKWDRNLEDLCCCSWVFNCKNISYLFHSNLNSFTDFKSWNQIFGWSFQRRNATLLNKTIFFWFRRFKNFLSWKHKKKMKRVSQLQPVSSRCTRTAKSQTSRPRHLWRQYWCFGMGLEPIF